MSSFDYIKTAIRQKGCTLQQVADASGMTKGYLSQLLNAKIKSPSAQKLEALHRFLGLEFPRMQKNIGVVFGKFYPLHTGHIYLIQRACSQVDELHIIMGYDETRDRQLFEDSAMSQQPTVPDRLRWLLQTFKYQKNIRIHAFNEEGMEPYPHGWDVWSNGIKAFMEEKGIAPNWIYTSEESDAPQFREHLGIETVLIDPKRTFMNISGAQIRENPFRYWDYIPTEVKPFFVRTVAILGGESSGKSTLVNKLANIFNTTSAWEYGRDYVFSHLGGDEMALQYSDYDKIALGHAQYIDFAVKYANKVAFIDTDFVTTQAFCKKYEGREHPFADHFAVFQTVNTHVHDDCALFDPLARNKARLADRNDQQIGVFDVMTQVFGEAVGDGGGAARQQQLHAHRAAHDVGGANHHGVQAIGVDVITLQQRHDAARGARTQARRALAQAAHVIRMETVNVFVRRDTLQHLHVVDARRQRQLNQNAVDLFIGIQGVNQFQQFCFAGGFRQIVRAGDEPHLFTRFAFAADINLRSRVAANQHNGQPWGAFSGGYTRLHFFRNLRAHLLRNRFTVNNLCCHQREDSVCNVRKGGLPVFCQKRAPLSVTLYEISSMARKTPSQGVVNFLGAIRM